VFGDGTAGHGAVVTHTYATSDTYTVVLTATNGCGAEVVAHDVNVTAIVTQPLVFDEAGVLRDWAWLVENFGAVELVQSEEPGAAHIIELHASTGAATLEVWVRQADGTPSNGTTVVRYWPSAPPLGDPQLYGCDGLTQGVYGDTEGDGHIGFGMGGGDYYWPPSGGASAIWVGRMASDCIKGLGMIGETEHRHLNSVFQLP
jgi:PKD repeat protein